MPVRNDASDVPTAIASVTGQQCNITEIAICVGPSDDDTAAVVAKLADRDSRIRVVENPAGITPTALNAGIAATKASVIVRVDARSKLPDGYVHRAVATLERTGAANVGGVQHAVGHSATQRAVAAAMTSSVGVGGARFHIGGAEGPADTVYLGVFQRAPLDEMGGFDEQLVRNQDYELNWRLRDAGYVVWFDPELRVDYQPRKSLGALAKQYWEYGRWKREVVRRHPRSLRLRQLAAPIAVLAVPAGAAAGLAGARVALAAPAAYMAVLAYGTVTAPGPLAPSERLRLPAIFATMHAAWGSAFLAGSPLRRNQSKFVS